MDRVQVAVSADFLNAFARLPKAQQKKVREFTEKFRQDPTRKGINYEKINGAADSKVRSVRIDQTYRAIVVKPPQGNVYLCAWVDHHDDAYAWAVNKRFEVNPHFGHIQVYEVLDGEEPLPEPQVAEVPAPVPGLLSAVTDDALELFGVPPALFPSVRKLRDESDLTALDPFLPADVSDALHLLAAGYTAEEVIEELDRKPSDKPASVDTQDFETALKMPETKRAFKVVESNRDLAEILSAPLEQWRVFLHPTQRKLVEWDVAGPIRVLGGAGTGKTVVLMHRAAHLARLLEPDQRLLVTTFTRNLALELENYLQELCGDDFSKVEVANLHAWASRFLAGQGVRLEVASRALRDDAWQEAIGGSTLDLPDSFYRDEWTKVVQANDITDRTSYLRVRRAGRGTRLSRKQRAEVWRVFEAYRGALERAGKVEMDDIIREARLYIEKNPGLVPYRAVLSDEIQDFRPADLRLLRTLAPPDRNDLFLVGDAHQRIYGHKCSLGSCDIEIRGRSRRLKINYRTTENIGRWAVGVLEGIEFDDLDEGKDTLKGYRSLRTGTPPQLNHFAKDAQEAEFLVSLVRQWLAETEPRNICLTARTRGLIEERYRPLLENAGIDTVLLDRETPESSLPSSVRLSTMHRMKGLEFPRVIIAGLNARTMPLQYGADFADDAGREDYEQGERCLLYVSATRARDELVVTGFGTRSPFVGMIPAD